MSSSEIQDFNSECEQLILFENDNEESEDELNLDLLKFDQAVIWGTDWTAETIAFQLEKGNIDLNPSFQRRDAWSDTEKSKLIESLMLGLPVPPIILAENRNKKNSYIVIDGKQRLLSIRRFYSSISDKEIRDGKFQDKAVFAQLKLKGLEILKQFNGCNYEDVKSKNSEYITNLDNQPIRTIVIKNWPDESFLYTVFLRLNTGSKKLSPQELRQALRPGSFLTYLDDATANSDIIKKMLNNKGADPRMKDIELAIRFFAFKNFSNLYSGNIKEFLDITCEKLNQEWEMSETAIMKEYDELEKSIEFSMNLFNNNSPFSRYTNKTSNNRFNRSIFELFSYYFSIAEIRDAVEKDKENFISDFINLNNNTDFIFAVNVSPKEVYKVVIRFEMFFDLLLNLPSIKDKKICIPKFVFSKNKIIIDKVTS